MPIVYILIKKIKSSYCLDTSTCAQYAFRWGENPVVSCKGMAHLIYLFWQTLRPLGDIVNAIATECSSTAY